MRSKFLLAAAAAVLTTAVAAAAPGAGAGAGGRFGKLDTDGNGSVTRAEMDAKAAERFAAIDADKDGFLTQAELSAHHEAAKARWAERAKERAAKNPQRAEQRAERFAKRGERMAERAGKQFARRDANGDGRISLAEFQAGSSRFFERFDADKNGSITQEELAKARGAHRGKRQG